MAFFQQVSYHTDMTIQPVNEHGNATISQAFITPRSRWLTITEELQKKVHPADFWKLPDSSKTLTVAIIRSLQVFAESTPVGQSKIICIEAADTLNVVSANALLKLLEEPPTYVRIVLLAETDHFLPTIKSRLRVSYLSSAESSETVWHSVFTSYDLIDPEERDAARSLLYLLSLVHTTIKAEQISEPFLTR